MFGQRELEKLWSKGPDWVGAYMAVAWFYAATAGQLLHQVRHAGALRRARRRAGRGT